jgi:glycyl-tRNA synthetase beta chain
VAVALAEKIDKLTGFWAIDEKPTGSKDPFALRRAALGVIRLVLTSETRLNLTSIFDGWPNLAAKIFLSSGYYAVFPNVEGTNFALGPDVEIGIDFDAFGDVVGFVKSNRSDEIALEFASIVFDRPSKWSADLLSFFHDRLKVFLKDEGISHDVIDASLAMPGNDDLLLLVNRAKALAAFLKTDDGVNLIQGFKRANNILSQAEDKDGVEYSFGAEVKFADTDEERALFKALDAADTKIAPAMAAEDFGAAMSAMADLRAPIDAFFNTVQINADSAVLRRNRLNLLHRIRTICLSVADLRKLEG